MRGRGAAHAARRARTARAAAIRSGDCGPPPARLAGAGHGDDAGALLPSAGDRAYRGCQPGASRAGGGERRVRLPPQGPACRGLARAAGAARGAARAHARVASPQRGALPQPDGAFFGLVLGAGRRIPAHLHVDAPWREDRPRCRLVSRPPALGSSCAQPERSRLGTPPRTTRAPRAVPRFRDAALGAGRRHALALDQRRAGVRR